MKEAVTAYRDSVRVMHDRAKQLTATLSFLSSSSASRQSSGSPRRPISVSLGSHIDEEVSYFGSSDLSEALAAMTKVRTLDMLRVLA